MKDNKIYITLALIALMILGTLTYEENTTDHTKETCYISEFLYYLGKKDEARNHQVNVINTKEGYSAKYVNNISTYNGTPYIDNYIEISEESEEKQIILRIR